MKNHKQSHQRLLHTVLFVITACCTVSANAFNISLDQSGYQQQVGDTFQVTVTYDFSDLAIFGGGFNLHYDPNVLEFVSYTQADYDALGLHPALLMSPTGALAAPGEYTGAGLGIFKNQITGINDSGPIGNFMFALIAAPGVLADTPCGASICLTPTDLNPWFSLAGNVITDQVFSQGISQAQVSLVPLPAAFWFLCSGLFVLLAKPRSLAGSPRQ